MNKCKQHNYKYFLMSIVPNAIRQCTFCGDTQIEVPTESGQEWKSVGMLDLFGDRIYIITADEYSFKTSQAYLAEDFNVASETFLPLLTTEDLAGFNKIFEDGGRPCVVLNPVDWFQNPYLPEWNVAAALSSNVGGILLRPLED